MKNPYLTKSLPQQSKPAIEAATIRQSRLTKPEGSLGRLEALAIWLAGWQNNPRPKLEKPVCIVFAGNHGIAAKGVSAFPASVTAQMVANFEHGGAAINQLCNHACIELKVIAIDLDHPTEDFTIRPALSNSDFEEALTIGVNACMEAIKNGCDCLLLGEMGIGNTSAAAAIATALFGGKAKDWVGPGTGVHGDALNNKAKLIDQAIALHACDAKDGMKILQCFGGRELVAIAGAIMAARLASLPVILDGYVVCAAAAPLLRLHEDGLDHCVIAHLSAEPGHKRLAEAMHQEPLINFNMRLGEASGAALVYPLIKAALAVHNGMVTFEEAGVSES